MRTYDCKRCNEPLDRFHCVDGPVNEDTGFCSWRCRDIFEAEQAVGAGEMSHEQFVDYWGFQPQDREP